MPLARARGPPIHGAMIAAQDTPIAMAAAANGTTSRPRRLDHSRPMPSASTIWPATFGSGCRTAITRTTSRPHRRFGMGGAAIAMNISFAADPGLRSHPSSGRPSESGSRPTSTTAFLGSGLRGALRPEALGHRDCWFWQVEGPLSARGLNRSRGRGGGRAERVYG